MINTPLVVMLICVIFTHMTSTFGKFQPRPTESSSEKDESRGILPGVGNNDLNVNQFWRYILQYLWRANLTLTGIYHVYEFLRHLLTIL